MSILKPHQRPGVRTSVITTDLPLMPDQPTIDPSVIDFCKICKKCAETCPSKTISFGDRQVSYGTLRWRINPEACYTYWTQTGTDCGRCMSVCPYAYADALCHNLIRWGIRHSGFFRRAALVMDNIFYGKSQHHDRCLPGPNLIPTKTKGLTRLLIRPADWHG